MSALEGEKVISSTEAARIEKMAIDRGKTEMQLMEGAGKSIADALQRYVERWACAKHVTLVVGKGNNGGDAYAAGVDLVGRGFAVVAWQLYPTRMCSSLSQTMHDRFVKKGGKTTDTLIFLDKGVILDGIYGTGFVGKVEPKIAAVMSHINAAKLPIIAIDIPSGVNGNTGEVGDIAIHARVTFALEFPKTGCFLGKGWDYVGEVISLPYGLDMQDKKAARADGCLFATDCMSYMLPPIRRSRHKYETGYVLGVAGSQAMPGAALLASFATLRAGAGIVRLLTTKAAMARYATVPHEVICESFSVSRFKQELQRAKSAFLGPGIGRSPTAKKLVHQVLSLLNIPVVVDADALYFLPSHALPAHAVLTPQHAEMEQMCTIKGQVLKQIQTYVDRKKCTVVFKGGPTWVFHPHVSPILITQGHPALAKAGTGDVLTGVIAALLAQGLAPRDAAVLGTALHGLAGEYAAAEFSSYGVVASDLFATLPRVMATIANSAKVV